MKIIKMKIGLIALLFIGTVASVSAQSVEKVKASVREASVEIKVTGMTCAGCASHVYKVLSETDGVIDNEVKYPGDIAVIKFNANKITSTELVATIEKETNYKAALVNTEQNK